MSGCATVLALGVFSCAIQQRAGARVAGPREIMQACPPCHGVNGAGRDVETPNLAGQSGIYLYNQPKPEPAASRHVSHRTESDYQGN